jgi:hypothetical protein
LGHWFCSWGLEWVLCSFWRVGRASGQALLGLSWFLGCFWVRIFFGWRSAIGVPVFCRPWLFWGALSSAVDFWARFDSAGIFVGQLWIVEAEDSEALARGMQGLKARIARALNRLWGLSGPRFPDRYHSRVLRTLREVRSALLYVLDNARRHGCGLSNCC